MTTTSAAGIEQWRAWLAEHGESVREVWLVIHHRDSGVPSVRYHDAIEQALCYGWIDSQARKTDPDSSLLRFTPRNPRSTWSRVNRERATRMIAEGWMTERGQAMIDLAKAKGTWQVVPDDQAEQVPADLQDLLDHNPAARTHFAKFPPSSKRRILEWIATAKKTETRYRRITRTVHLATMNLRANHPGVRLPQA